MSMWPRAFLFDLDGSLVDSERENADSIEVVLGEVGRKMTAEERDFVVGHGWREIYEKLRAAGGVPWSFEELKERAAIAKERICEEHGLAQIPGAVEYVRRAAARTRCAVVSGSSRREIAFCIQLMGLEAELPWFIGAEDVQRGKPSPEGYLMAAARMELSPSECLVFEDSAAGIAAARAAGMRCVALSAANILNVDQSGADLVVRDYHDLAGDDGGAAIARLAPEASR